MLKKVLLLALVLQVIVCIRHPVSDEVIQGVRSWETMQKEENPFSSWEADSIKSLFGSKVRNPVENLLDQDLQKLKPKFTTNGSLPESYDARSEHGSCMGGIRNQLHCGSCWAFAAAETLSDNLCIAKGDRVELSAQDLVSCDTVNHGCQGGDLPDAWKYLVSDGIRSQSCLPYTSGDGTDGTCPVACTGSGEPTKYKCDKSNFLSMEDDIKNAIMQYGSAETGFYVYEDFMNYKSGIYKHESGQVMGGHAVKIVGWGKYYDKKYWLVANSWGTSWGLDGYFKIDMSDKDSGFALGGAFSCGDLKPYTPPVDPVDPSKDCKDIASYCKTDYNTPDKCAAATFVVPVCKQSCGCCDYPELHSYCKTDSQEELQLN